MMCMVTMAVAKPTRTCMATVNEISAPQQQRYVVLTGTNVRLRFEPNLNCSWLHGNNGRPTYLPKGSKLPYKGEAGDFYRVTYNNQTLYVAKQYSYVSNGNSQAYSGYNNYNTANQKMYVVINGVNVRLRTGPSTNYRYFTWDDGTPCYLPKGTYLEYLGQANDFYKCTYQGRVVFISKKFSYVTK